MLIRYKQPPRWATSQSVYPQWARMAMVVSLPRDIEMLGDEYTADDEYNMAGEAGCY